MIDINPLNVLKSRHVKTMPIHFKKIKLSNSELIETDIISWIENKLKGRYSLSFEPNLDDNSKLKNYSFIGFEDQKELTYFLLACPYLRRN